MSNSTIQFSLKAKPFSINKAYYKRTMTRTQACRDWGNDILTQIQDSKIIRKLKGFKSGFDPIKDAIRVTIIFFQPKEILYTKKGDISRRSQDLSNVEKLLIDLIFDSRFHGRIIDELEIETLCLDDKYITQLHSSKTVGNDFSIDIKLERIPK